jgi:hypothetical protein
VDPHQLIFYGKEFYQMWKAEWRNVASLKTVTIYDFYTNNKTNKFAPLTEIQPVFQVDPEGDVSSTHTNAP